MGTGIAKNPLTELSGTRKIFLDSFNISALFSAIPAIATSTGLNNSRSVWLNSAYQLSFAALLLVSGRMSDIYNPKIVFLSGVYLLGILSLGTGFARNSIAILVLRALSGIGVALSIPSALHLLIHTFPDPLVQAKSISAFAALGAIGNVFGVIVGALIVSYVTWPWIFYATAIVALLVAIACTFLIPNPHRQNKYSQLEQFRRLDMAGSTLLIAALVLFIFAVTSGSTEGWKTSIVLVPLSLSDCASLPPRMWSYLNFAPLTLLALLPFAWWSSVYLLFAWYWQEVGFWSAINSGIHFLPMGLLALAFAPLMGVLRQKFDAKHILLGDLILMVAGTAFFPFADNMTRYWSTAFPGFLLGTAGTIVVFATTNIAVFATTPPEAAGTVGAVFNCALQLGAAVITWVATSIQTSVQPSPTSFVGRATAFEFLIAFIVMQIISVLAFVRKTGTLSSLQPEGAALFEKPNRFGTT
ncbi:major facilitator superfamily domain-containing protein [Boletus coccyginus]|nr:major facilitator superfamily domain-containing protein [Boletus coccyginus]